MIGCSQKKVSVIIPVFNAEKYIESSVASVLDQTHTNVEIVLVDDCSTDGSFLIEEQLSRKYENIILVQNKDNSGQTLSRNHGLECISGDWFMFLDADDELENTAIFDMLSAGETNEVDIVMCDYSNIFCDGKNILNTAKIDSGKYKAIDIARLLFDGIPLNMYSCVGTKLYKRDILGRKQKTPNFPRTGGDFMFITDSMMAMPSVYYLKKSLYKYFVRTDSISHKYRNNMYTDLMTTRIGLWRFLECTETLEMKKDKLALLRYEIVSMSLAQETYIDRSYEDFLKMYNFIFSDKDVVDAILLVSRTYTTLRTRWFAKLFFYPRILYYAFKVKK